ncbi:LuxR C-terminal-related transcriptional regulator [Mycobacterium asiaticum]|uniref:LuxR C-terminal-related transcriptional regulator n=1 Tax=Mycobacterium asiaticum TaxID=1790 RepID=UPI001E51B621|nr:LuxR C-terminal-related transcriptional regulator [Mycobacterium asiaticum]
MRGRKSPPDPPEHNRDAGTPAPSDKASTPSVSAAPLVSADSRSSDKTGFPGRNDAGGETAARAVLLATKLHIPAIGAQLVHRVPLLSALTAGRRCKLTLLSAPAGWGKTTLLAQWALGAGGDEQFGWLSLDASDNDPVWFWMYVIAGLQKISPGVGVRAVELLAMGADPVQVILPTLLNDLDNIDNPIVLILDDYHQVVNRTVHEQLAFFITRMPANLHLVLATRSDPNLPLARLRASGDLNEMRTEDLRFGAGETNQLLNDVLGLNLDHADVALLHQRTEGWAAGLYLAALSLAGRTDAATFIKTFAGDNRHVVDYLMAEVLDGQPPQTRTFLLRTSVLGRLSGPLCDAVLQTSDASSVLEKIDRENLFVVPLDTSRHWYRYHQLFGELLRTELRRSEPTLVADLHRRAATWFETEGLVDEAVRHLIAAGDIERSAELIAADWVEEFNGGGLSTVSAMLDLLPEETVLHDPRLCVARAWIALSVGQLDDAADWIEVVENRSAADSADGAATNGQAVVLRAVHSFKTAEVATALAEARRAISLDLDEAPLARSNAYNIYGAASYFSDSTQDAHAGFRRAVQEAEKGGNRRSRSYGLGYLALISAERGQLADAEGYIRRASGSSHDLTDAEHHVDAMVSLATAETLRRRGDTTAAVTAVEVAIMLARQGGAIPEVGNSLLVRADIFEQIGDYQAAKADRDEAASLLRGRTVSGSASTRLVSPERTADGAKRPRNESGPPDEELTPKELEILRLLATRLSRREIGDRLYVSLNTVKTHQRAVYRKLRVEHRGAAVSRARELGLL